MTPELFGAAVGAVIAAASSAFILGLQAVVAEKRERVKQRLAMRENQLNKVVRTTLALYRIEAALIERLSAYEKTAPGTLRKEMREIAIGPDSSNKLEKPSRIKEIHSRLTGAPLPEWLEEISEKEKSNEE